MVMASGVEEEATGEVVASVGDDGRVVEESGPDVVGRFEVIDVRSEGGGVNGREGVSGL
jgi:hypothetical protein